MSYSGNLSLEVVMNLLVSLGCLGLFGVRLGVEGRQADTRIRDKDQECHFNNLRLREICAL